MNRRDLLRALAAGMLLPQGRRARARRPAPAPWTFRLDGALRWSLIARNGGAVVSGAELSVALAGADARPLAALAPVRRFRLEDQHGRAAGWQVVGIAAEVEVAAQFLDGPPPRIAVTARGLGEVQRLDEIRFLDTLTAVVPALEGRPTAWINGRASSDPCALLVLDEQAEATSHWQLALFAPGARALALTFGVGDTGDGRFTCGGGRLVVATRAAGRPLSAELPPAAATLALVPGAEPLQALARLSADPSAPPPAVEAPTGWTFRPGPDGGEDDLLGGLEAARAAFGPSATGTRLILLGDGYQRAAGDWNTNGAFPHGHRWLTDRLHEAGFRAGLWLAPFAVAERSGVPTAHPDWLLRPPGGDAVLLEERGSWGGRTYALDAARVDVRDYLRDLVRLAVTEWGYDVLELDELSAAVGLDAAAAASSPLEAYRAAMHALREGAGGAYLIGGGAPLQHTAGLVDALRIGPGAAADAARLLPAARAVALRAHFDGAAWRNMPGDVAVGEPLTPDEAKLWASVVAFSGGPALAGGAPARLPADRLELVQRAMPVALVERRAFDLASDRPGGAAHPGWILAQVRDDWWMLALLNWDDAPRKATFALAEHGIRGPLAVYDVWEDRRRRDADGTVALDVAAHSAAVLSLRRRRRAPCVIGATRHVLQGVVDLFDEQWDAEQRVLTARAIRLDGRPYAATIALPPGFRPQGVRSDPDVGATVEEAGSGAIRSARLAMARPAEEVSWVVEF